MSEQTPTTPNDLLASLGGIELDVAVLDTAGKVTTTGNDKSLASPSNHFQSGASSSVEEKALALLGAGVSADQVASALGVTPSRISQLLAEEVFSKQVSELRYEALQQHNVRDSKYDRLEDTLLDKLEKAMPLLIRPGDIINAMTKVNNATRRGQSAPTQVNNQQNIVNLVMPTVIVDRYAVSSNSQNQVVRAGDQDLLTMQSGNLLKQVEDATAARELEHQPKED